LTRGQEAGEAHELWTAVEREHPRLFTPLDQVWLNRLLATQPHPTPDVAAASAARQDWGESPETVGFIGRDEELALLRNRVLAERRGVVAILGMGGIGKTSLAARLAREVVSRFERVYWRSLRNAPSSGEWLAGAIGFLSDHQLVPPPSESEQLTTLLQLLRERPSLLVLDNFETLLEAGPNERRYRTDSAGYGRVVEVVGEGRHQSCLVLTSREAPPELSILGGSAAFALELGGMRAHEGAALLAHEQLVGNSQDFADLIARFGGNVLALKLVGETIRQLFGGDIGLFLQQIGSSAIFGDIRRLLGEQIEASSALEQDVLRVLAVEREPVRLTELVAELGPRVGRGTVLDVVGALRRRSLVERTESDGAVAFTLQPVVLEYVTDRLVEAISDEIARAAPVQLVARPLIRAQAKDYVRHSQERLIGEPILEVLNRTAGIGETERQLAAQVERWRGLEPADQQFGPGNVVNLLRLLRSGNLRGMDLSRLSIRQAYLAGVEAQDASLAGTTLVDAVLAEAFDFPGSVALTRDGTLMAAGTSTGQVWLWRVADRTPVWAVQGHTGGVWGVALSDDGQLLASGGTDGAVRLWEARSGQPRATLHGHAGTVYAAALSADGRVLATGGTDTTVRLWDTSTGGSVARLDGHTGAIFGVALSVDGQLLASGGGDGTVRLWETSTGRALAALQGHTGTVWGVALSADGELLASVAVDGTVRVWETSTGRQQAILHGHSGEVYGVALSADGQLLASSGGDGTVRVWETRTGQPRATLPGHTGAIYGVALSAVGDTLVSGGTEGTLRVWETDTGRPQATLQGQTGAVYGVALAAIGQLLASAGTEGTVRQWEVGSGRPLATLHGHAGTVYGLALSPDGELLASGGTDGSVRLWEPGTGRERAVLEGHEGGVRAVALSADGRLLASAGTDGTARLWEISNLRRLAVLEGHAGAVYGVALSADGLLLASSGTDGTVRVWDATNSRLVAELAGHAGAVYGVTLSPGGELLASCGADGTVRLWDPRSRRPLASLRGHTGAVYGVVLSADGQLLVSGGGDGTVRLWHPGTGEPVASLKGHMGAVYGVALSADRRLVASGGFDGTVRVWEAGTGAWSRTLRAERRYERLDITCLSGVTNAQRQALFALGAVDRSAAPGA
jgi:WD40 repeat protein